MRPHFRFKLCFIKIGTFGLGLVVNIIVEIYTWVNFVQGWINRVEEAGSVIEPKKMSMKSNAWRISLSRSIWLKGKWITCNFHISTRICSTRYMLSIRNLVLYISDDVVCYMIYISSLLRNIMKLFVASNTVLVIYGTRGLGTSSQIAVFKHAHKLVNLRVLKFLTSYKNRIFQCMGKIRVLNFKGPHRIS